MGPSKFSGMEAHAFVSAQVPLSHFWPLEQTTPQAPQALTSVCGLTSQPSPGSPSQSANPPLHKELHVPKIHCVSEFGPLPQTPDVQTSASGHPFPQPPQLYRSVIGSTQPPQPTIELGAAQKPVQ